MIIKASESYTIGKRYKYFVSWCYKFDDGYVFVTTFGKYMSIRATLQGFCAIKKYDRFDVKKGWFLRIDHVYYEE